MKKGAAWAPLVWWRRPSGRRAKPALSIKEHPCADQVLLLDAGLGPVADPTRENGLQPRPLRRREGGRVIRWRERLELALHDVGGDAGPGDFAREGVGRIERVACR